MSSAGSYVDRFERECAAAVGADFGVAMTSGTTALHIALLLSNVKPGEEVILPALTFVAPANAVRYVDAWPTFIDIEPDYGQMDSARLEAFLREDCVFSRGVLKNRHTGRSISAILPVHLLGHPTDLHPIQELGREFGLTVIEDATESIGARYRGRPVGSCGSVAVLSFNGNKLLTTGGGGMLVTDSEELAEKARYLTTQAKDDPIESVHRRVGYNYRLTNLQAAIGCAQLEQLAAFIEAKRRIARRYEEELVSLPGLTAMGEAPWAFSIFWMYTVRVNAGTFGGNRQVVARSLAEQGIETRPLWQPLHRSPAHATSFACPCPVSDAFQRDALSLPCSTGLTSSQQMRVIEAIRHYAAKQSTARSRSVG